MLQHTYAYKSISIYETIFNRSEATMALLGDET